MKNKIIVYSSIFFVALALSLYMSYFSEKFSLRAITVSNYADNVVLKPYKPLFYNSIAYKIDGKNNLLFICHSSYMLSCLIALDEKNNMPYIFSLHKEIPFDTLASFAKTPNNVNDSNGTNRSNK